MLHVYYYVKKICLCDVCVCVCVYMCMCLVCVCVCVLVCVCFVRVLCVCKCIHDTPWGIAPLSQIVAFLSPYASLSLLCNCRLPITLFTQSWFL